MLANVTPLDHTEGEEEQAATSYLITQVAEKEAREKDSIHTYARPSCLCVFRLLKSLEHWLPCPTRPRCSYHEPV